MRCRRLKCIKQISSRYGHTGEKNSHDSDQNLLVNIIFFKDVTLVKIFETLEVDQWLTMFNKYEQLIILRRIILKLKFV